MVNLLPTVLVFPMNETEQGIPNHPAPEPEFWVSAEDLENVLASVDTFTLGSLAGFPPVVDPTTGKPRAVDWSI